MIQSYAGILGIDEYGCLTCGENRLIEDINSDFDIGDKVFVRYFITDKEVPLGTVETALAMKSIGAAIEELDFVLDAYSEYTILDYNEEMVIGGHDLFRELRGFDDDFLILVIEKVDS